MYRRIVTVVLLAVVFSGRGQADADDGALTKVAGSCSAAAAWIKAHRAPPQAPGSGDHHAFSEPALRAELHRRVDRDQQARDAWVAAGLRVDSREAEATRQVDAANTAWFKGVFVHAGFPTPAQVGMQGVTDAWLLVQHADQDPAFQSLVLDAMEPRVHDGSIRPSDYAMLVDRVRLSRGRPQLYGSQFAGDAAKPGEMHVSPVEDPAHLDERRASMGLMPMHDYECALRATYAVNPAQK
ncbi:DUF6624 domain-containing protein [Dyella japonica]|uniref:DUF6624 domain-containing protein n=1 Tax=Dyella japonica TaxID=231455 RepID=UPI000318A889|nr:DUF6624 domain-containing protein [Dyella japonica]